MGREEEILVDMGGRLCVGVLGAGVFGSLPGMSTVTPAYRGVFGLPADVEPIMKLFHSPYSYAKIFICT